MLVNAAGEAGCTPRALYEMNREMFGSIGNVSALLHHLWRDGVLSRRLLTENQPGWLYLPRSPEEQAADAAEALAATTGHDVAISSKISIDLGDGERVITEEQGRQIWQSLNRLFGGNNDHRR
jgi:hypothetical protein